MSESLGIRLETNLRLVKCALYKYNLTKIRADGLLQM